MDFESWRMPLLSLLGVAGMSFLTVEAQTITLTPTANNLYNTGYSGTIPAGNNQADTHYQLIGGTAFQSNPIDGNWAPNPVDAQWITVSNAGNDGAVTVYDYRLVLTNIPAGRLVTIGGVGSNVAVDDSVTVVANGSTTLFSNTQTTNTFANYFSLNAIPSTTFISGTTNTLDFLVGNIGGPTGLLLELTGSYTALTGAAGLNIQLHPRDLDPNQQAVITNINQLNAAGVSNGSFSNLTGALALVGLSNGDFGAALDELSPEKLRIFSSLAFNNAGFMTQDLDDYLAHRRTPAGYFQANAGGIDTSGLTVSDPTIDPQLSQIYSHLLAWSPSASPSGLISDVGDPLLGGVSMGKSYSPASDPWNVFIQGDVILGQDFSDQDLGHADSTTSSFEVGADYQVSANFLMGAFFNYNHTDATLDNNGSSATVDSYAPGVYASYAQDGWYGNALAGYSHNAYTEQRNIDIGGAFNETASGAPEGDQETVNLDGGYDFHDKDKKWTFGPTLGFQYVHLSVASFAEAGGAAADLAVADQSADSFRSRLGGHVNYAAKTGGLLLTPFLDASWQHEFLDDARGISSSFSGIGAGQFTVFTPDPARESALLTTGLNIDIDGTTTVFTDYQVQVDPGVYFGQSILAGVKVAF
jgi:uncharacterized protein YhjY with autotransporter beta-barrel domain